MKPISGYGKDSAGVFELKKKSWIKSVFLQVKNPASMNISPNNKLDDIDDTFIKGLIN